MIKWFVYIVFLLVFTPCLLSANVKNSRRVHPAIATPAEIVVPAFRVTFMMDTIKALKATAKVDIKVKEVAKAKKQPKPEKVDDKDAAKKEKPKRQRRPDGMERPPEIPRRNDN